jgi:HEPN domain-containing protein
MPQEKSQCDERVHSCDGRRERKARRLRDDIETAEILIERGKYLNAAFFCQQSIEKAFKAVIETEKVVPPHSHNLYMLATIAKVDGRLSSEQTDFIKSLTFFYIESRYSDVKMNIANNCDIDMVTNIFEQSKEMVKWLSSLSKERLSRLNS